jgi:hypothetical protein
VIPIEGFGSERPLVMRVVRLPGGGTGTPVEAPDARAGRNDLVTLRFGLGASLAFDPHAAEARHTLA